MYSPTTTRFTAALPAGRPALFLAPMREVTDLPFWRVLHRYGGPDVWFTEYFRAHATARLDRDLLHAIRHPPGGRPVIAQIIGRDIPALLRAAEALQRENLLALDFNVGCPAPVVCRKHAGAGLLRRPAELAAILAALRRHVSIPLTVKTRVGFTDSGGFDDLLNIYAAAGLDALTVHGRTASEMYRGATHYDLIARAARTLPCPVIANGNIISAGIAARVAKETGAAGLMLGRGCIRNPWIFTQIRELFADGHLRTRPTLRDLREYIGVLWHETKPAGFTEKLQVARMKKHLNFIAQKIDADDEFPRQIRRADSELDFFQICDKFLDRDAPFDSETPEQHLTNPGNPRVDCY
ncbi:MAG: tRNA-dihydrouridine synthase family protein [Verrucomicrobiales bacterium]|jgi:nifR3 family TIM-barrel protein|nr:tRNA-dihydrouridine synthase family protein [Verrucomicrobiales bacterium]